MFDTTGFEGVPNRVVVDGIKRLHKVNCRTPHFDSPHMACLFNHPVSPQVIYRLVRTLEPSLIFGLNLIKAGIESVVQDSRKQFVKRWQKYNSGDSF